MNIQTIWVNLPIKDIQKTRDFWTKLGFGFNENFSDEKALCLILKEENIYAMLITHEFFSTFTNRPIADGSTTQVLNAIQVDSVNTVNKIVSTALANGGTRYKEAQDHEWMYYDTFADIDGHQWEIMYADYSKIPS
jgi:predicted lactoylglutathione lyase